MRLLPALAVALIALALLAGCASKPQAPAPTPTDDGPDRVARQGSGSEGGRRPFHAPAADNETHKTVTLVSQPIQMVGSGPVTYDADIPADTTNLTFDITNGDVDQVVQLRVEVSDCGAYDSGQLGISGSYGGGGFGPEKVCATPKVGKATVTISGQADILTGTFELKGEQPLG